MNYKVKTAILIIGFKRKDALGHVFNSVRKVNPDRVYIALDGARINNKDDKFKTGAVRELCDSIDWCRDIRKKYREENAGCKKNVEEGISWAFEEEEQLIILEDDIVPSVSFYRFCDEMLDLYQDNSNIYNIEGYVPCDLYDKDNASYFFSKLGGIWGWATWKRAWQQYDSNLLDFEESSFKKKMLSNYKKRRHALHRYDLYKSQYLMCQKGESDSWAYSWSYSILNNDGYIIRPKVSLIRNIGFGEDAHNGGRISSPFNAINAHEISFPLRHPKKFCTNKENDAQVIEVRYRNGYPLWYAFLGHIYRKHVLSTDLKLVAYLKKAVKKNKIV